MSKDPNENDDRNAQKLTGNRRTVLKSLAGLSALSGTAASGVATSGHTPPVTETSLREYTLDDFEDTGSFDWVMIEGETDDLSYSRDAVQGSYSLRFRDVDNEVTIGKRADDAQRIGELTFWFKYQSSNDNNLQVWLDGPSQAITQFKVFNSAVYYREPPDTLDNKFVTGISQRTWYRVRFHEFDFEDNTYTLSVEDTSGGLVGRQRNIEFYNAVDQWSGFRVRNYLGNNNVADTLYLDDIRYRSVDGGAGGGNTTDLRSITCGETRQGEIDTDDPYGDRGYFEPITFDGTAGCDVTITMRSDPGDTYLKLYDPDGNLVAENDDIDFGDNLDSRITHTLGSTGQYTIHATSYSDDETFVYDLTLECTCSSGNDLRSIACGETKQGEIDVDDPDGDRGYYEPVTFEGSPNCDVTVTMRSDSEDTYLKLYDPDGSLVAENDDALPDFDSQIDHRLESAGQYTIHATSFSSGATFPYDLSLECDCRRDLEANITQISSDDFPLIDCFTSVTDGSGDPIRGLGEDNFEIYEDGDPQSIERAEPVSDADSIVNVALVIDDSESMEDKIDEAKAGARSFVSNFSPDDRGAVFGFDDDVQFVQEFTSDTDDITTAIDSLVANGETALFDAVERALEATRTTSDRQAVVVLADGDNNEDPDGDGHGVDDVVDLAVSYGIPVYTIGLETGDFDPENLRRLATETSGDYYEAPSADDLSEIYVDVSESISSEYQVTYRTDETTSTGGDREVETRVEYDGTASSDSNEYTPPASAPSRVDRTMGSSGVPAGGSTDVTVTFDLAGEDRVAIRERFAPPVGSTDLVAVRMLGGDGEVVFTDPASDRVSAALDPGPGVDEIELVYSITIPRTAEPGEQFTVSGTVNADGSEFPVPAETLTAREGGIAAYADSDGIIDDQGLAQAINDWVQGEIGDSLLNRVIQAWVSGEPVV
jgi:VWFA-related protein